MSAVEDAAPQKFACLVRARAHPGRGNELIAGYQAVYDQIRTEDATELYVLNQAIDDPDVIFCFELFSSRAEFDTHRETAKSGKHLDALNAATAEREFVWGTPVWARIAHRA